MIDKIRLQSAVDRAYEQALGNRTGSLATYIPELAECDPEKFSISLSTADGFEYSCGDAEHRFTLQSACKPFLFWQALDRFGRDELLRVVGVEPTTEPFDSFIRLETHSHRPHNPMMNAGAISVSSLLCSLQDPDVFLHFARELTGNPQLQIDLGVYLSEQETADKNRAISYLLSHFGMLKSELESSLNFYLRACSVNVTTGELARMGVTLALGGVQPFTKKQIVQSPLTREVLSVMMTCGIYQHSGQLAHEVGFPAKSGVSGSMIAVLPGLLSVAIYSPRLDEVGNSCRAIQVLRILSQELDLHLFGQSYPTRQIHQPPPVKKKIQDALKRAEELSRRSQGGVCAQYAPELAQVDPNTFSASVCTVTGEQYSIGSSELPFSLQASANPLSYAFSLQEFGAARVHEKVGVQPSGNSFDEIIFEPNTGKPFNPLTNSGAIALLSLLDEKSPSLRLKRLLKRYSRLLGGVPVHIDSSLLRSEHKSGDRNRAIAHLLKRFSLITDVDGTLDLYFQQCSIQVTTPQLALMAGVLAAYGRHPLNQEVIFEAAHVKEVLTTMFLCGMHDLSGEFAFTVGIPAKSGISGALLCVIPGVMGIGISSPRVDEHGCSVRGVEFLKEFIEELKLNLFG